MTFDANVSTTWGSAIADIRDKVGGMTNWSIKDDSSGGATSLAQGDYFVLTNAEGEDIRIEVSNGNNRGNGGIGAEYGPSWDASGGSWSSRYSNDPHNKYYNGNGRYSTQDTVAPVDPSANTNDVSMSSAGTYWLSYADSLGFCFYFQREEGDGQDGDVACGWAEVNQTWDYSTAASTEAEYAIHWAGCRHERVDYNDRFQSSFNAWNLMAEGGTENDEGYGNRNPDANFDNYPFKDPWMKSSQYQNGNNNRPVIGTHDLWLHDRSGSDLNHKDTVTDGGGTTTHTVLKYMSCKVGIRHI